MNGSCDWHFGIGNETFLLLWLMQWLNGWLLAMSYCSKDLLFAFTLDSEFKLLRAGAESVEFRK
jgi:hypothetical protein